MKYPQSLVGWLYDIEDSLEWKVSPLDVLLTEKHYPGLIGDLSVESWQRKLIRDQIKGSANPAPELEDL